MRTLLASLLALIALAVLWLPALALEPPPPGMIEQMKADGTYEEALARAEKLGNHQMKAPLRGLKLGTDNPHELADLISRHFGRSLNEKSASAIGTSSIREYDWLELDLNHDRTVDERDVLALGFPRPKTTASYPTIGTAKTFCLLIEFPDYAGYFPKSDFEDRLFGDGDTEFWYHSLKWYYDKASYSQLTVDGDVHGWYEAEHNRTWYHPDNNTTYPEEDVKRELVIFEAIEAADEAGTDFSEYDNDGDGEVDYFLVIWAGPHGAWASFWWGYQTSIGVLADKEVDGVRFHTYSWQWECYYDFGGSPPDDDYWQWGIVPIHETGHALGLPDYYDYNGSVGPDGGVGGMDMMHGNSGDHNCFSKYCLGWISPTVAFTNLDDQELRKSNAYGDAVAFMPGFDPVSPWSEYFMAQVRYREGSDGDTTGSWYPTDGRMALWHIDAQVANQATWPLYNAFVYDNSYTDHKLLRLMEADGLEEIETGNNTADIDDYYNNGEELSPSSSPNSYDYSDSDTGITVDDISSPGQTMTADFTLYTSNPPTVTIDAPDADDTVSGDVSVEISASDDNAVDKVQLLIDGWLVREWTSGPYEYTWNSLVDFNQSLSLTARAWDGEDQVGSDTISVTVSNSGVTSVSDGFESGLVKWRIINDPADPAGTYTIWGVRASPGTPTPPGSGNEAWVDAANSTSKFTCSDHLRSERIGSSSYTRDVSVKFYYRCRDGFSLWATADEGDTWDKVADIASSSTWASFSGRYDAGGEDSYFRFYYEGTQEEDQDYARSANIDEVVIEECPSDPPTVSFSDPDEGDTVSGDTTFSVSATDDGTVARVLFYFEDLAPITDSSPPWQYTRDTTADDNHPSIPVVAIAYDDDDLPSDPAEITVAFKNERPYPVLDDLESGTGNWYFINDTKEPKWQEATNQSHSSSHSMGWITGSSWQTYTSDYILFEGEANDCTLQSIDLSGDLVDTPTLKFWYRADFPTNGNCDVYFYNSWDEWLILDCFSGDQLTWTEKQYDLSEFEGYSGWVGFGAFTWTYTAGATGLWIDDVRVENQDITIFSITPDRAEAGTEVTVSGTGFWLTRGTSYVTFGGDVNPESGDYVSWGNTEIKVYIPLTAQSGDVTVTVGAETSNGYNVRVILGPPNLTGGEQF